MKKIIFILAILLILVSSCVSVKDKEVEKKEAVSANPETPKTNEEAISKKLDVVTEINSVKENLNAMEALLSK